MAYQTHDRDIDERSARLRDSVYGANRFNTQDSVPSGSAVGIMFGAVVAILLLIGLFSWSSSDDQAGGTQSAPAIEQSDPAPAAPAQ